MCKCCYTTSSGRVYTSDFEPVTNPKFDDGFEKNLTSVRQVKGTVFLWLWNDSFYCLFFPPFSFFVFFFLFALLFLPVVVFFTVFLSFVFSCCVFLSCFLSSFISFFLFCLIGLDQVWEYVPIMPSCGNRGSRCAARPPTAAVFFSPLSFSPSFLWGPSISGGLSLWAAVRDGLQA